jgi:S-DNA-T family DNA segregation ATPase FtsK/SpoIIIE
VSLLDEAPEQELSDEVSEERLKEKSEQLEKLLASYNIEVIVRKVSAGPVITLYEIDPAPGVKVSQINNLSKDIARGLAVMGVRVLETIPGSTHVGIEVPNHKRMTVYLREVFESREFIKQKSPLTLVLGKDIGGKSVVANLAKMPHLLVAGTTGSGKSVAVNAMLLSILFKATPHEVRLIMIDPKMLELSIYDDIPHLLTPVVTDMKEAANSLRWCVTEMERRYKLLSALKVRNIASYNEVVKEAMERGEPILDPLYKMDPTAQLMEEAPPLEALPFIVVVIDELADMMMVVGKKVEELIARLAQKARAAGIHLILATQRPSVDVITGLIKANVPTRIAFQVSSRIDSRTILDTQGAENLLGNGDMLYMPPGSGQPSRAHGAFVDDDEVVRVVDFLKSTGTPNYIQNITVNVEEEAEAAAAAEPVNDQDELYDEAVAIVTTSRKATISFLQRQLRVGFNRAARLVEDMEAAGVVSTPDNGGTREVLAPPPTEL